ncbi:hypothetical protein ACSRUE_10950 [Sorangium sp. KYC3313]|uniref:hypothetical protein n=1 Tax=Sorangium sp. KYC3313 TaxID=3449740 RepID=UPI003F8C6F91
MSDLFDSDSNELFPPADRAKIEALTEDPDARVSYELTKGMLAWSDEQPRDVELSTFTKVVMLSRGSSSRTCSLRVIARASCSTTFRT